MVMSWIFTLLLGVSLFCAMITGNGNELSAAILTGAQAGVNTAISLAGAICLWSGVGKLMDRTGVTRRLSRLLQPILWRIFPASRRNRQLCGDLSTNICANILGLGNAATPMGIRAAKGLVDPNKPDTATDEMCRLVVLNTASIQLLPTNIAALRANLGCATPFDILPAVWISSIVSAGLGLTVAWVLGKMCHD